MANNTNLQNSIVTAGRFIEIGSSVDAGKGRLRDINVTTSLADQTVVINRLEVIADDGITPDEKIELKKMFEGLLSEYSDLSEMVKAYSYPYSDWDDIRSSMESIQSEMLRVLAEMDATTLDSKVAVMMQNYIRNAQDFTIGLRAYIQSADGYEVAVQTVNVEDGILISAVVTDANGVQATLSEESISSIRWNFVGTSNDEQYCSQHAGLMSFTVGDEIFNGNTFTVNCSLRLSLD